jgi:endonuclease/exonuclease/phosphatase family metal-dependent hydrolase
MKVNKGLNFFDKILLWINIFLCATLLLSYLAPITDPAKYWVIAFFGLAYPVLLIFSILFVLYWLLRKSIWVLLPVICILIGWHVLNENIGFRSSSSTGKTTDTNLVRLMTYNVHNFKRYGAKNDVSTKHDILQIITDESPDILAFQEFYSRRHGEYDMVDTLKKILNTQSYYFEAFESSNTEAIGMAIFSKLPIVAHGLIPLSSMKSLNQCLYIDVKKGNKIFRVYNVQLQSIRFDPEDYRYLSKISGEGKADMGSTKRLGSKLKTAFIKRSIQVVRIKQDAAVCPYPYIIAGDFNDTPTSYAVNQMSKGLTNAFFVKGSGLGRTYNGDFPNYQIDYVMASPAFDVRSYNIIEKKLSDHYPVRCDLAFK